MNENIMNMFFVCIKKNVLCFFHLLACVDGQIYCMTNPQPPLMWDGCIHIFGMNKWVCLHTLESLSKSFYSRVFLHNLYAIIFNKWYSLFSCSLPS